MTSVEKSRNRERKFSGQAYLGSLARRPGVMPDALRADDIAFIPVADVGRAFLLAGEHVIGRRIGNAGSGEICGAFVVRGLIGFGAGDAVDASGREQGGQQNKGSHARMVDGPTRGVNREESTMCMLKLGLR